MLKVYNTLTRKKEIFKPIKKNKVNLFVCGPTVYDFSHLGHARTYLVFDMIVNYLKETGFDVFYLQNITDIDDKIINRAKEKNINPESLAKQFEREHLKDMENLKITSVNKYAKATEHIPEIISQVEKLLKNGFAYKIEDGIYYNIKKFKDYGKLSRRTVLQAEDGVSRIDEGKNKKNKGDFCLWKLAPNLPTCRDGAGFSEPSWSAPFGRGRPRWHIEDTAIAEKYFGYQYDAHGGARELMFPHHEAEIAQMEAISDKKPMVKYWLHTGLLTINGQKMSKSLGNFITIRDFLKTNQLELLRLFVFLSHYRSPVDYNLEKIKQVKSILERLNEFYQKIKEKVKKPKQISLKPDFPKKYLKFLDDDFNTPKFFSNVFDSVRKFNKKFEKLSDKEIKEIYQLFLFIDKVFKIFPKEEKIPENIINLVKLREKYRREKNWQKADEIRKKVQESGYSVEDTETGQKIKRSKD